MPLTSGTVRRMIRDRRTRPQSHPGMNGRPLFQDPRARAWLGLRTRRGMEGAEPC